jgi:hypothetical protein
MDHVHSRWTEVGCWSAVDHATAWTLGRQWLTRARLAGCFGLLTVATRGQEGQDGRRGPRRGWNRVARWLNWPGDEVEPWLWVELGEPMLQGTATRRGGMGRWRRVARFSPGKEWAAEEQNEDGGGEQ